MALDSSGNIAVDYVWGNFPLQPNTERTGLATASGAAIYNGMPGGKAQFATTAVTGTPTAGMQFVWKAVAGYSDVTLTIDSVQALSPSGFFITCVEPDNASYAGSGFSGQFEASENINVGGGEGDYGWAPTTKEKSAELDPALDGHNITTEFWNNFPDYTPNVGFVPQQLFEFTVVGNSNYNAAINLESNSDDPYEGTRRGYILTFNGQAISAEKSAELLALIQASQLAGERVPAFSFPDSYGNTVTAPQGWIVGADFTPGMYGDTSFSIQIATADNAFNTGVVYIPVGTTITLGIGAPKTVLFEGKLGTDFANAYGMLNSDTLNGTPPYYNITSSANAQFPAEFLAAVNSGSLVGAWIGVGPVEEFGPYNNGAYYPRQNIMKINNAFVTQDMYGNSLVRVEGSYSWAAGGTEAFYLYETGAQIVIVK